MKNAKTNPPSWLDRLLQHKLILQFIEYMIGGGVYFFSGLAIFAVLYSVFHWDWLWAKIVCDIIGWSLGFLVQRYWAFYDKRLKGKDMQIGTRYVILNVVNFGIDYAIVATMKHYGVTPYLGMLASSTFFIMWNYLWYRFWVFDPNQKAGK